MNYYRPTYADAMDIFRSPPEHRPFVDLSMTANTASLPIFLRKINSGATRWANLVIGVAVDGAIERGVTPKRIARAFKAGTVAAQAYVDIDPELYAAEVAAGSEASQGYKGSVELANDELTLSGGNQGDEPDTSITFIKQGEVFVPLEAAYFVRGEPFPRYVNLSGTSQDEVRLIGPDNMPETFVPFAQLGQLEEAVTNCVRPEEPVISLHGDIPDLMP